MKFKTTEKAIRNSGEMVISVGYCELWHLLRFHSPVAYTAGVYGWNFDVYEVYGVIICTGYRRMVGKRARDVTEYEQRAHSVYANSTLSSVQKEQGIEGILKEFIKAQY